MENSVLKFTIMVLQAMEQKTGHGLRNMDMRAKRIGSDIDVSTENGFTVLVSGKLNTN